MSGLGKYKLSDAIPPKPPELGSRHKRGQPRPDAKATATQSRKIEEASEATDAEESTRDRMVTIGRGNQQSGRQGDS